MTVPSIEGQAEDLQILVTNLLQNAKEAMPNGGTITIKTTSDEEHVIITIADTGCGIPEELREKVFEPFFSTHVTKGRGLGLPIVFRIVREHLGTLELISEVNKGTTFVIKLPVNC
jgi:signal transduction histidine kinase